jgi:hypothetical protein
VEPSGAAMRERDGRGGVGRVFVTGDAFRCGAVRAAVGAAARRKRGEKKGARAGRGSEVCGGGGFGEDCVSRFSIHRQLPTYLPAPSLLPSSRPLLPPAPWPPHMGW